MFLRSEKRSVPGDFEEAKRPTKMQRIGDIAPVVLVAAQSSSVPPKDANGHHVSAPRSAKRKLEQQDATSNSLPSKKIRLSANGDDFKRSLPGLRGGSTRRRRKVVGSDGEDGSSSPTRVTAAQSPEKNESEGEPTSSSPTSATEGSNSNNSSEPTSSSPKPIAKSEGDETQIEPTSSSTTAATDTESGEINNREPTSSSPQQDDSSATSADNTCEPAEEPKEPAVGPSDATDPKTTTSEGSATMNESEAQTSENPAIFETRLAKRPQRFVNGLLNNSNQCFANSTIQFFDAAVEGHDLDMVLGEVEEVQNPAFAEPMLTLDDDFTPPKKTRGKATKRPQSKLTKIKNGILRGIKKLRGSGDLKDISPRRHMRRLLHRMRQSKGKGRSNWVTPFVFQQILAYGDENADRELLDGMEQQDAYEYFQAVLAGMKGNSTDDVSDGEDDEKSAIIDHLFNFKSETATICTNEDCDHRAAVQGAVDNAHVVYVSGKRTSVTELLDESTVSELKSEKCPKCDTETLERRTEFKEVADNFVVHINRTDMSDGSKRKTAVELPLDPFELCGKEYVLNAVIRHKGDSAHAGHYTILRRRSPEWHTPVDGLWFLFNDDEISPVTKTQVQKDSCSGQSSLLLFKAL